MAYAEHVERARKSLLSRKIDEVFEVLGKSFSAYVERKSRAPEIARLNAMTDEQLARLGISRDRIVNHVFRDTFYI